MSTVPRRSTLQVMIPRMRFPLIRVVLLAAVLLLAIAVPALAHEEDVNRAAADLVRQAIALLATTPDDLGELREKLEAAVQAEDRSGVDLALVEQATTVLFDEGDPHRARALLEQAVGARPHIGLEDPAPIRQTRPAPEPGMAGTGAEGAPMPMTPQPMEMARGAQPGATLIADPLETRPVLTAGDWALLGGSLALGLTGVWLVLRRRPAIGARSKKAGRGRD
jgi:hypothetical protein